MDGIDISRWQAGMNLAKVPADFVIVKATEGNGYTDPEFHSFAKATKKTGRLRGLYHFARADLNPGTGGARREADWFVKVATPYLDGQTILVLDWEAGSLKKGAGWAKVWLDRVRDATGCLPLVYTSSSVTRAYDWSKVAPTYPLWCANYGTNPIRRGYAKIKAPAVKHWDQVSIHQYGSRGRLKGWSGNLDINRSYVSARQWRQWAGDDKQEEVPMGMVSPTVGRVSSRYGPRNYAPSPFHAGLDIANDIGTPVYAMYGGTVKDEGANIAPYRSGDRNVLIENPDGEAQYYGHLDRNVVRKGQKVEAGEIIGYMGARGNVTGPHLHLEVWADADRPSSHRDPEVDFDHWDITPGSTPETTTGGGSPAPTPRDWLSMATKKEVQEAVEAGAWNALQRQVAVGGATGKRHGGKAPFYALSRDAAYGYDAQAAQYARLLSELGAIKASLGGNVSAADVAEELASLLLADLQATITDAIESAPERDADQIAQAVVAQMGERLNPTAATTVEEG